MPSQSLPSISLRSLQLNFIILHTHTQLLTCIFTYINTQSNRFTDVNWKDRNTNSILHVLAYRDQVYFPPLIHSFSLIFSYVYDQVQAIELLLAQGADPNVKNRNGETPIHWASKMSSVLSLSVLLMNGADVNAQDNSGSTAMHYAALRGIPEVVPMLLSAHGFQVNLTSLLTNPYPTL